MSAKHEPLTFTPDARVAGNVPFFLGSPTTNPTPSRTVFSDQSWDLRDTIPPQTAADACTISWTAFPSGMIIFKDLAWYLINEGVSSSFVTDHGLATVHILSAASNYRCVLAWGTFARWLRSKGISHLEDLTPDHYRVFYDEKIIQPRAQRGKAKDLLISVSRLWDLYSTKNTALELPRPPWYGADQLADHLPQRAVYAENLTPVLPDEVISPLLAWACKFVNEYSHDIFKAKRERDRLKLIAQTQVTRPRGTTDAVITRAWFAEIVSRQLKVPSQNGRFAKEFVAASLGLQTKGFNTIMRDPEFRSYVAANQGPAPMVNLLPHKEKERPWGTHMDYYEVDMYWRLLSTAALICIGYLTGMRQTEILNLEVGCCTPDPQLEGRWEIQGTASGKTSPVLLDEGKQTWTAIAPVAQAIKVLEKMTVGKKLFNAQAHGFDARKGRKDGSPICGRTVSDRLRSFADFIVANDDSVASMTLPTGETIDFMMFRRTLAYFINREPGGTVALAAQYGHMRTATSEGYATRRRDGFPNLVKMEAARAAADVLAEVADELEAGGQISGPAAGRLIASATSFKETFQGRILTERETRRLLQNSQFRIYQNPDLFVICNFDPSKAQCLNPQSQSENSNSVQPRLAKCKSFCANIARTDSLVDQAEIKTDQLDKIASSPDTVPFIRDRLRLNVDHRRRTIEQHRTRGTALERDA